MQSAPLQIDIFMWQLSQVGYRTEKIQTVNSEKQICKCPPCNLQILIFAFQNFFECVPEQSKNINQRTLKIIKTKSLALNVYVHFVMKIDWSVFKVLAVHRHKGQCRRESAPGIRHHNPAQDHSCDVLSPQVCWTLHARSSEMAYRHFKDLRDSCSCP
jgi:hypothetical protein